MTMTLSGDGTITGLVAGGLPNATVTADDLAAGAALNSVSDGVFFRNRIINGDMRIDQRNAGAAVTIPLSTNTFSVDRFPGFATNASTFSLQQNAGSVTPPSGFTNYLGATTLSAFDVGTDADAMFMVTQFIEGFNVADLEYGTANAKTVTLSFWVRSSLTGSFGGSLQNHNNNRSYPYAYTISSADTWEYKTITIPGDITGTWLTNENRGISVRFSLGGGANRLGTANAWNGNYNIGATGTVSVIGTLNATWYITGVQLEVGSVATPFERRPYGMELSLCQRYFYALSPQTTTSDTHFFIATAWSASQINAYVPFPVTMRSIPTMTYGNATGAYRFYRASTFDAFDTLQTDVATNDGLNFAAISGLSHTSGVSGNLQMRMADGAFIKANAEL